MQNDETIRVYWKEKQEIYKANVETIKFYFYFLFSNLSLIVYNVYLDMYSRIYLGAKDLNNTTYGLNSPPSAFTFILLLEPYLFFSFSLFLYHFHLTSFKQNY